MNFDDLKKTWQKEMHVYTLDVEDSIKAAQKTDNEMKRGVIIETCVCVALFGFSIVALAGGFAQNPLLIFSTCLMAAVSIYIPYRLLKARTSAQLNNWTLRANLEREIEKLTNQRKLLSGVITWYLAPLSVVVFTGSWGGYAQRTGTYVPDMPLVLYWSLCVLLGVVVIVLNKLSVRRKLTPALDKLLALKSQLEEQE